LRSSIERTHQGVFDGTRHLEATLARPRNAAPEHLGEGLGIGGPFEELLAREQFPKYDARHKDVALASGGAVHLLRGPVAQATFELPGRRDLRAVLRLGDSEVQDARDTIDVDDHVVGTYVAMNQLERLAIDPLGLVRGVKAEEHVADDSDRDREWDRLVSNPQEAGE